MALTPNQVAAGAVKFSGLDDRSLKLCIVYLLNQWLTTLTGMALTPNQVATNAKCFQCPDDRTLQFEMVYLLNQILANGGGGGGGGSGSVLQGTVNPTTPPASPNSPALYTNLTTGSIFTWNVTSQSWQ